MKIASIMPRKGDRKKFPLLFGKSAGCPWTASEKNASLAATGEPLKQTKFETDKEKPQRTAHDPRCPVDRGSDREFAESHQLRRKARSPVYEAVDRADRGREQTPALLWEFVEKIIIHESEALDGKRRGKLPRPDSRLWHRPTKNLPEILDNKEPFPRHNSRLTYKSHTSLIRIAIYCLSGI